MLVSWLRCGGWCRVFSRHCTPLRTWFFPSWDRQFTPLFWGWFLAFCTPGAAGQTNTILCMVGLSPKPVAFASGKVVVLFCGIRVAVPTRMIPATPKKPKTKCGVTPWKPLRAPLSRECAWLCPGKKTASVSFRGAR